MSDTPFRELPSFSEHTEHSFDSEYKPNTIDLNDDASSVSDSNSSNSCSSSRCACHELDQEEDVSSEKSLCETNASHEESQEEEDNTEEAQPHLGDNIERHQQCRICHDSTIDSSDAANNHANPLIQPCKCRGTMKYVHLNCWDQMHRKCRVCNYPPAQPPVEDPRLHGLAQLNARAAADMEVDEEDRERFARVLARIHADNEAFAGPQQPQQPRNADPVDENPRVHIRLDAIPEPFIGLRAPQQPRQPRDAWEPLYQLLGAINEAIPILAPQFQLAVESRTRFAREALALQRQMMERLYHLSETRTYQLFHGLIVVYFATILIGMIYTQWKGIIA